MRLFLPWLFVVFFTSPFIACSMLVNFTIDDSDVETIRYVPTTNWHPSGNFTCSGCLSLDFSLALQRTVHYGLNVMPSDQDPKVTRRDDRDNIGSAGGKGNGGSSPDIPDEKLAMGSGKNASDSDAEDTDVNVMASLNFTGSAFYVYCVLPLQSGHGAISSMTNLTFLLDGSPVGSFVHNPQRDVENVPDFKYQVPVFFKGGLPQVQHTLDIKAELGSAVLLDYVTYSTLDTNGSSAGATPSPATALPKSDGNTGDAQENSNKNAITFGLAIGLTVGVLTLISLGVFASIYRRRRRSARLQRRIAAEEEAATSPGPEMRGPEPFIPRYFPGTVVRPSTHSPPPSPSIRGDDSMEEIGPSHGLNLPQAPEHTEIPGHSSPQMTSTGRSTARMAVPHISTSIDTEDSPPRYQDVGQSLLVSIPFTYPPPPPPPPPGLLPYSPPSPRSASGESFQTPAIVARASSRHSDSHPSRPTTPLLDEPPINTHSGDWQR